MDTTIHEDVLSMAAGPSAVDTMQPTSSSLFNALTNIFRTSNTPISDSSASTVANVGSSSAPASAVLDGITSVACLRVSSAVLELAAPPE